MHDPIPDFREPHRQVIDLNMWQLRNALGRLLAEQPLGKVTLSEAQLDQECQVIATRTPAGIELEHFDDRPVSDQFPVIQHATDLGKGLE